jgi:hypothetical protein
VVLAADSLALQISGILQFGDDPLNGSLRDTDRQSDFAQGLLGIAGKTDHDMRMVGEEIPIRGIRL